jgi:hypothetical protein
MCNSWCYETEIQNTVHPVILFWWSGIGRTLLWLPPGSSTDQPEKIERERIIGCYINIESTSLGCQSFKHYWPSAGNWKRNHPKTTTPKIAESSKQQLLLALSAQVFHNSRWFHSLQPLKRNQVPSLVGSDQSAPLHALEWSAHKVICRVKPTSERRQTIMKQPVNANWPASSLLPAIYWIAYHRPENMIGYYVQQNSVRAHKQE